MATYVKRNNRVRAVVRIDDKTETKTFDTKADAQAWAVAREVDLRNRSKLTRGSFGELLQKVLLLSGCAKSAKEMLRHFARLYADVSLKDMTAKWWIATAKAWNVSPSSRTNYFMILRGAMKQATYEDLELTLDFASMDTAKSVLWDQGAMKASRKRDRRITDAELAAIKLANTAQCEIPFNDIVDFAVLSGMRRSEITRLSWHEINFIEKMPMIWLRDCKDPENQEGNDFNVPLLNGAYEILKRQPKIAGEARIFPCSGVTISNRFRTAARKVGIKNIHFHDLRHEALSRLSDQGYVIEELAKVSRHKQVNTLMRYLHIRAERLHDGPMRKRA
jgi:integrase